MAPKSSRYFVEHLLCYRLLRQHRAPAPPTSAPTPPQLANATPPSGAASTPDSPRRPYPPSPRCSAPAHARTATRSRSSTAPQPPSPPAAARPSSSAPPTPSASGRSSPPTSTSATRWWMPTRGAGMVACARKLFDEMPTRDVVSWTSLVSSHAGVWDVREVSRVLYYMRLDGCQPSAVTLAVVLRVCTAK
ncbi:Os04g0286800 [Oryza sativa Japonica Group]|uniref:Os04g0286800 protein n=1 Tax=Oryza sativa subsp. japonica TaxID=39947 RepID=A0A0P0W822_ORYSJ|nr:Os04g0286800 [Oryza sativa Japonica Group]